MFRKLLSFDEAKELIDDTLKPAPLGKEEIELLQAYGRVLAQDVVSELDIPPFSRATVDGYAVKAEDTFGADEKSPAKLNVVGMICIGEAPNITLQKGEAAEIVTGAPIPAGADAVIMIEDTEREDNELSVYCSVTQNNNIMKGGTDIKKGEELLECGTVLGSFIDWRRSY
jgi:molybdopterin biosynthesis enzyme